MAVFIIPTYYVNFSDFNIEECFPPDLSLACECSEIQKLPEVIFF